MSRQTGSLIKFGLVGMLVAIALMVWLASSRSISIGLQNLPQSAPQGVGSLHNYSPYVNQRHPIRVYWGETHLHTSTSPDAGLVGDRLGSEDAFRLARGEQIKSSSGQFVKLERPYDWMVVSDHAEYMGLPQAFKEHDPDILKTDSGKKWAAALKQGGQAGYEAFVQMTAEFAAAKPSIPREVLTKLYRKIWDQEMEAVERNNKPGTFSAIGGFEWTQSVKGNNLHRTVVFRDGPDRTKQVLPFSEFDGTDPEDLWKYMADYETRTGGRVLAIEHNPNLSGGQMFAPKTWTGQPFDANYAAMRARFEPLAEVTQSKGDSETTPQLSPHDGFADFERWNKANIFGLIATTPEMLPFNYVRSALKLGLEHESKLGVNPFKFGLIGASDQHTSLSTTRAENYFGVGTIDEPKPDHHQGLARREGGSAREDHRRGLVGGTQARPEDWTGAAGRQHSGPQQRQLDKYHRRSGVDQLLAGSGLQSGRARLLLRARDRDSHSALDRVRRQAFRRQDEPTGPHDGDQSRLHVTNLV
jgi:hypothetical protein